MEKKFENGLFIFRRDLRIVDNMGLLLANQKCKNITPIFIFTPEQVGKQNKFKSDNSVQFMIESLQDLYDEIRKQGGTLYTFYGKNSTIVKNCIDDFKIDYICFNVDYTPYAIERDTEIVQLCAKKGIICDYAHDYCLLEPGSVLSGSGTPYQKFTPFYNACLKHKVQPPSRATKIHFSTKKSSVSDRISLKDAATRFTKINNDIDVHGGREIGIRVLQSAHKTQNHYEKTKNTLIYNTSRLSAYTKYGCVSIREAYHKMHGNNNFIRQLWWRDFYMNILYSFPRVLGNAMKPNYNKVKWHYNASYLKKWQQGETGFPIVDAAMTELNITGYMHNRGRLIVASFLVKTLLISWEHGEEYFATKLTDYDIASNNGNWQWIAGTGADSQPYFRVFNPWSQSETYDKDALYIKKWLPQLEAVLPKDLHTWNTSCKKTEYKEIKYPEPIVDYTEQKEKALKMYAAVFH